MGHTTDFIGHIDITPPINQSEQAGLEAANDVFEIRRERWAG